MCSWPRIAAFIHKRQRSPWLWNDTLYSWTPSGKEHDKCLKILHDFTNKVVRFHFNLRLLFCLHCSCSLSSFPFLPFINLCLCFSFLASFPPSFLDSHPAFPLFPFFSHVYFFPSLLLSISVRNPQQTAVTTFYCLHRSLMNELQKEKPRNPIQKQKKYRQRRRRKTRFTERSGLRS